MTHNGVCVGGQRLPDGKKPHWNTSWVYDLSVHTVSPLCSLNLPSVSVSGVSSQLTVCCPPPSSKAGLRGQQELQINSISNEQSIYSNYNWSVCSGESAYLINRHQRRFRTRSKSFWGGVVSAQTSLQTYEIHDAEGFSSPAHMWWMVLRLRTHPAVFAWMHRGTHRESHPGCVWWKQEGGETRQAERVQRFHPTETKTSETSDLTTWQETGEDGRYIYWGGHGNRKHVIMWV